MRTKLLLAAFAVSAILATILVACTQTPTEVPVRTFERAQHVDVVCLQVYDPATGLPQQPKPQRQEECAPVPAGVAGDQFINQLFAVVTQSSRGEVAVVNLSAQKLVDQKRAIPGVNFIPVGAIPTDIAASPDGQMVFVGSSEVNKPAIYGVPSRRLLGDVPGFPNDPEGEADIRSWPVCALPQNPGAIAVLPRTTSAGEPSTDAGAADASDGDAGTPAADEPAYDLVVVLPGDRLQSAKVVTLDPRPFLRGARVPGVEDGPTLTPGTLAPCPVLSAVELVDAKALPASFRPGDAWPNGVPYVDGGIDLTCDRPAPTAACGAAPCCSTKPPVLDAGSSAGIVRADAGETDSGSCEPTTDASADAGTEPLDVGPLDPPRLVSIAKRDRFLYIADENVPFVHVVDLSVPRAPKEIAPLLATSLLEPSRPVSLGSLAISPETRDYKRFLYAVDKMDGSLLVYDVTDPNAPDRMPLRKPNPELNPFDPPDRLAFPSPVVSVAFARHDFPLAVVDNTPLPNARSGLLCNPNPNLDTNPTADYGFYYRAGAAEQSLALGPQRLRGIFAFAVMANGAVSIIDVDDWDAPCRRPVHLDGTFSDDTTVNAPPPFGALAIPQVSSGPGDIDPYHAPVASVDPNSGVSSVTDERFFPVIAPHRRRSYYLLSDTAQSGKHAPFLTALPQVSLSGVPMPFTGPGSEKTPRASLSFSHDVPDVHVDQDWAATFEGILPGDGLATIATPDAYSSLVFSQSQAAFCSKGIEDWDQGRERAHAINQELASYGIATDPRLERRVVDYVQLTEDLLDPSDPYWSLPDDPGQCWDPSLSTAEKRYDACNVTFGAAADQNPSRDFPILEAYDDKLVLGRFYTPAEGVREVVYKDPSNANDLKMMACCFHNQARFRVRTGGTWSVVGNAPGGGAGLGFLNHGIAGEGGRCSTSCDPREALLNGRVPAVSPTGQTASRDGALVMRNPMFSLRIDNGYTIDPARAAAGATSGNRTPPGATPIAPVRDTVYAFSTRGQFVPYTINIAPQTTQVSPQSIRYVDTLGQLAVVDAVSQGLVLIDLDNVTIASGSPYF